MADTAHWPKYQSHKIIQAAKIVSVYKDGPYTEHFLSVDPGNGVPEKFVPTEMAMVYRAEVGGYAVSYDGGKFLSVSPKEAFDGGYTLKGVEANG